MPTGYTAGILDGTINTFPEFAKTCIRAFGAAIHMRDDSLDVPYTPRTPSNYHLERIEETESDIAKYRAISDEELVSEAKTELIKNREYHMAELEKSEINQKKLNDMLDKAKAFKPPTKEHVRFKEFMIEQLESTIKHDCYDDYHSRVVAEIDAKLNKRTSPKKLRAEKIKSLEESLNYHRKHYDDDVKGCEASNKWVTVLLESI